MNRGLTLVKTMIKKNLKINIIFMKSLKDLKRRIIFKAAEYR